MPVPSLRSAFWATTALPLLLGTPVAAQSVGSATPPAAKPTSAHLAGRGASPAVYVGFNVWVGAVTAGVRAQRRGAPVLRAALAGAAGGAMTAAGQRLIGVGPAGWRLGWLQLTALGANVARNAGDGVPVLSDVVLPVYPLYIRIQPGAPRRVRVRVSAMALRGLVAVVAQPQNRARLDLRESVRAGAPVFRSPRGALGFGRDGPADCADDRCVVGLHFTGAVVYARGSDPRAREMRAETLRHEAGHLAQFARDGVLFGFPASDRILSAGGRAGRWARGWLAADVALPLLGADLLSEAVSADPDVGSLYEREVRGMMR